MYMYCAYFCYMFPCTYTMYLHVHVYMYPANALYNVGFIPATRASTTKRGGEQSANSDKTAQRYSQQQRYMYIQCSSGCRGLYVHVCMHTITSTDP